MAVNANTAAITRGIHGFRDAIGRARIRLSGTPCNDGRLRARMLARAGKLRTGKGSSSWATLETQR
jgi:hypothetical protein